MKEYLEESSSINIVDKENQIKYKNYERVSQLQYEYFYEIYL